MEAIEELRNSLISKILSISNTDILEVLDNLILSGGILNDSEVFVLTKEQKYILEMSEEDFDNGKLISQESMMKRNSEWLNAI